MFQQLKPFSVMTASARTRQASLQASADSTVAAPSPQLSASALEPLAAIRNCYAQLQGAIRPLPGVTVLRMDWVHIEHLMCAAVRVMWAEYKGREPDVQLMILYMAIFAIMRAKDNLELREDLKEWHRLLVEGRMTDAKKKQDDFSASHWPPPRLRAGSLPNFNRTWELFFSQRPGVSLV